MSLISRLGSPGTFQVLLLFCTVLVFYLELRRMPLECLMQKRMAQRRTFVYNPSFILIPDGDFCKNYNYIVIYQTRVGDSRGRELFREEVGSSYSEQYNFTILFPLGISLNNTVNEAVMNEHRQYGDILQADFLDTYRNLTLKTYAHSRYISQNCMNVRAVVKVDDDIAWNVRLLFDYLSEIDPERNALYCRSVKKPHVDRKKSSKWYVSMKEYPYKYFPEYCLSPIYAATPSTVKTLHDETINARFIWLDDVFSTGIVGREAGVSFREMSVNVDDKDYGPFLDGSVIAQYLREQDDLSTLLEATSSNDTASSLP